MTTCDSLGLRGLKTWELVIFNLVVIKNESEFIQRI